MKLYADRYDKNIRVSHTVYLYAVTLYQEGRTKIANGCAQHPFWHLECIYLRILVHLVIFVSG